MSSDCQSSRRWCSTVPVTREFHCARHDGDVAGESSGVVGEEIVTGDDGRGAAQDFLHGAFPVEEAQDWITALPGEPDGVVEIEDDRSTGGDFAFDAGGQARENSFLNPDEIEIR